MAADDLIVTDTLMGVAKTIDDAEKASTFVESLMRAIVAHPFAFIFVIVALAFVLCFLPHGLFAQLVIHRTEMRKLDERVGISRKKLTSGRQNRRKP